jgi:outer membrane protein
MKRTMNLKRMLCAVLLAAGAPMAGAATLLEAYGGVGLWNGAYDGTVRSGATNVDVENDLDVGRDRHTLLYAGFEHPVPILPNIRAQYVQIDVSGRTVLPRSIAFRGVNFPEGTAIDSRVELTQIDGTAYYKVWATVVELDLGLTLRHVDGLVEIAAENQTGRADFDGVLPMLHAAARVELPLTGLWAGAKVDGTAYRGDKLIDTVLSAGWQSAAGLGIEAGWRLYRFELDGRGDLDGSRIDIAGPYAALNFRF